LPAKVIAMEQSYWLGRKRASAANARRADSAEARLVHLDLAGRYSIKAAAAGGEAGPVALPLALPAARHPDPAYYEKLETGARWLASRAQGTSERQEHLGMANKYARLRLDAAAAARH
jgi:hypothetical protein